MSEHDERNEQSESVEGPQASPFDAIRREEADVRWPSNRMTYYVYTLASPDGRVFYVGKGTDDRIDAHERDARKGVRSWKCDIVRAIWARGGEVVKTKVGYFASNEDALQHEHFLISTMPSLANVASGEGRFSAIAISPVDQEVFGASIRHLDEEGSEYWSAREVSDFLGYAHWSMFYALTERVKRNQARVGLDVAAHFRSFRRAVVVGNGAVREIDDIRLTRIAFLLVLSSADTHKGIVAYGKAYIAQTALRAKHPHALSSDIARDITILAHAPNQKLRTQETPEDLPTPPDSIQQVERRERERLEREARARLQPPLFDDPDNAGDADSEDKE